jgi:hypothetical protein
MSQKHEALFALVDAGVGMRPAARQLRMTASAAAGAISRRRGYVKPSLTPPDYERPAAAYTNQICFRVDDDTLAQIDALAADGKTSRAGVVRELLEWALEEFS